jgi:hypothetical protein
MHVTIDRVESVAGTIRKLASTRVMVGIPSSATSRNGDAIGNATLGYIHENGSPINNIPARPFLVPGVRNSQPKWSDYLMQAGKFAMEGNAALMDKALHAAGLTAVNAVKLRITEGIPPPLSPVTVQRRRQRRAGSSYRRAATTPADTTPLVDTGQLLNSISYVIRKGKSP